jgi:hypothetical protein
MGASTAFTISIDPARKEWLDRKAASQGRPAANLAADLLSTAIDKQDRMPVWHLFVHHGEDHHRGPYVELTVYEGDSAAVMSIERAKKLRDDLDRAIGFSSR